MWNAASAISHELGTVRIRPRRMTASTTHDRKPSSSIARAGLPPPVCANERQLRPARHRLDTQHLRHRRIVRQMRHPGEFVRPAEDGADEAQLHEQLGSLSTRSRQSHSSANCRSFVHPSRLVSAPIGLAWLPRIPWVSVPAATLRIQCLPEESPAIQIPG